MDDPELLLLGAASTNARNAVIVLVAWMAMGFKLAFHKASMTEEGKCSTWTSSRKCVDGETIVAEIKTGITDQVRQKVDGFLNTNVTPLEDLRACLGRCVCVAGLIHIWRPFVGMMWAPLDKAATRGDAPPRLPLACLHRYTTEVVPRIPQQLGRHIETGVRACSLSWS